MDLTNTIINYRRFLKRRNFSSHTVKNNINRLKHFIIWLDVELENAGYQHIQRYIEALMQKRLAPVTINCHLASIRAFYNYLYDEEQLSIINPVKKCCGVRVPHPLPRYLKEEEIKKLFAAIKGPRDCAMFKLMLRCGLRVEEVANLTLDALDLAAHKILIHNGKGKKDRMVYVSNDAQAVLTRYLKLRPSNRCRHVFLVEKGTFKGKALSVRGIQKRIEYYATKAKVKVSCHHLRHTMATQMLNADARLATIQDLLGHSLVATTQRYCKVSNLKVKRDYYRAMEKIVSHYLLEKST
jgi:site-specific recombinase XerD